MGDRAVAQRDWDIVAQTAGASTPNMAVWAVVCSSGSRTLAEAPVDIRLRENLATDRLVQYSREPLEPKHSGGSFKLEIDSRGAGRVQQCY